MIRSAVLALSLCTLPVLAKDANRFESAEARFALTKPAGWRFTFTVKEGPPPLVAMTKYKKPHRGFNPNFQVSRFPLPPAIADLSPKYFLEEMLRQTEKLYADFTLESPIREVTVDGRVGFEFVATFRLPQARAPRVRTRVLVVSRPDSIFVIGMVAPAEGPEQSTEEFAKMLSSVSIAD